MDKELYEAIYKYIDKRNDEFSAHSLLSTKNEIECVIDNAIADYWYQKGFEAGKGSK